MSSVLEYRPMWRRWNLFGAKEGLGGQGPKSHHHAGFAGSTPSNPGSAVHEDPLVLAPLQPKLCHTTMADAWGSGAFAGSYSLTHMCSVAGRSMSIIRLLMFLTKSTSME